MTHVLQVVYTLEVGGSELLAMAIAGAGVKGGARMSLCGLYPGSQLRPSLLGAGVESYVVAKEPGVRPGTVLDIARLLRRLAPTTVVTHHLGQLVYGGIAARLTGARLIHVEHEWYSLDTRKARRMLRLGAMLAEAVVVPARLTARFLEERVGIAPAKIRIIPNGVDLKRFTPRQSAGRHRPVVGTVGRLDPAKDHLTLLAAFRELLRDHPDAELVVVGEGPTRPLVESYARAHGLAGNVRLIGARADVEAVLPSFDVFALSSVREGVPMALLEAMACRVPVVATDVGAVRETLAGGAVGRLVPPRDPGALARAVGDLLDDRAAATELAAAGRRHVEDSHDLARTVADYLALCRAPRPTREAA